MKTIPTVVAFIILSLIYPDASWAETLSYSGRLVNVSGVPVSGSPSLKFDLVYSGDTATIICTKTTTVPLSNGVFHANLDFTISDCGSKSLVQVISEIPSGQGLAYQVTDVTNSRAYGFQPLSSVPLSLMSQMAKTFSDHGATDGQILSWNAATKKWVPGNAGAGSGTLVDLSAGAGITVAAVDADTYSVAITNGGVGTSQLADSSVNSAKIVDGSILGSDIANTTIPYAKLNIADGDIPAAKINGLDGVARSSLSGTSPISYNSTSGAIGLGTVPISNGGTGLTTSTANAVVTTGVGGTYQFISCSVGEIIVFGAGGPVCQTFSTTDNTKLPLAGGTMTGAINMNTYRIDNLPTPVGGQEAATKSYVDALVSGGGWTISGGDVYRSSGNVGIGTNAPTHSLEVFGNVLFGGGAGTATKNGNLIGGGYVATSPFSVVNFSASSGSTVLNLGGGKTGFKATKELNFYTGPDRFTDVGTMKMHINSSGNVGVGTSAPNGKLDVLGSIVMSGATSGFAGFQVPAVAGSTVWTLPSADGSAGQILSTNGSGTLSWSNPSTGGGGDFFANGSVPMTGALQLQRNLIGGNPGNVIDSGASAGNQFAIRTSDADIHLRTINNNNILFTTSANERMRINISGNVGIGTTAPNGKLDVKGSVVMSGATSGFSGFRVPAVAGSTVWQLPSADGATGQVLSTDGAGVLSWTTPSAGGDNLGNHTATTTLQMGANLINSNGGTNGLSFDSAGRTYVTTTSGSSSYGLNLANTSTASGSSSGILLQSGAKQTAIIEAVVQGSNNDDDLVFSTRGSNVMNERLRLTSTGNTQVAGALTLKGSVSGLTGFQAAATAGATIWTLPMSDGTSGQVLSTNGAGTLSWVSATSSSVWSESGSDAYRSSGRVGMGTSSPTARLDVDGQGAGTTAVKIANSSNGTGLSLSTGSGSAIVSSSASGFGIQATSGNRAVNAIGSNGGYGVYSAAAPNSGTQFGVGIFTSLSGANVGYALQATNNSATGWGVYSDGNSPNYFKGKVGVNTVAPQGQLDVKGTLVMSGATSGFAGFQAAATAGSTVWTLPTADGANGQILSTNGSGILSWTTPAVASPWSVNGGDVYRASGNVGIGTSTPAHNHSIIVAGSATSNIESTSAGAAAYLRFKGLTAGSVSQGFLTGLNISNGNGGYEVYDQTAGASRIMVSPAGNVGIGTTTPAAGLDVKGPAAGNTFYAGNASASYYQLQSQNNTTFRRFGTNAADVVTIQSSDSTAGRGVLNVLGNNGATNVLFADASGKVGIGTVSPSESLEVTGNVKASSFISTSDERLKKNIQVVDGLPAILQLRGVSYEWRKDGSLDMGVIAQETERVFPWAVVTDKVTGYKAVKYNTLVAPLIEAVRDLDQQDRQLARRIASIEEENSELRKKNHDLESKMLELLKRVEKLEAAGR